MARSYGNIAVSLSVECLPLGDCKLSSGSAGRYSSSSSPGRGAGNTGAMRSIGASNGFVIRRGELIDARLLAHGDQLEFEYQPELHAVMLLYSPTNKLDNSHLI
ncbi:unnamed protein product [Protopolystoma xenopodis]|uniref:Uncharacterized protein n=1 Tax=Protopolystoma xenopodis TaxID=117903 RepID=A0A448X585_9PLAT|nr:unnamed protein product [Protopolystoma xenopodis]